MLCSLALGALLSLTPLAGNPAVVAQEETPPATGVPMDVDYKLGSQDKIRVMVYEWRPALDEIFAWSALNQEYVIGPTGKLSMPLIGEVRAAGSTTGELAQEIGNQLRDRMGLAAAPDTAVEVIAFRPFYVAGHVEKPGEYPFRPGLTALQALSISGGLLRRADAGSMRLERESMMTRGELELLAKDRDSLLARKARLEAEINAATEITFPPELLGRAGDNDAATALLLEQERRVFSARKQAYDTQMTVLRQLKDYLEKELASMTGQLEAHRKQMQLLKVELEGVRTLAKKGLTTAPRRLALERNYAQLEGDDMRLNGNVLRIRQEISRTEISMVELDNRRSGDATTELQQTQIRLEQVDSKTSTAGKLLYEAEVVAPLGMAVSGAGRRGDPKLTIVRLVDGRLVEITADELAPIQPGDTLKVELPIPEFPGSGFGVTPGMSGTSGTDSGGGAPPDTGSPKRAALEGSLPLGD